MQNIAREFDDTILEAGPLGVSGELTHRWLETPRTTTPYRVIKRATDIATAAAALFLLSPILFLVALLIRIDSKGPVLFHQTRVGQNGQTFRFWKFRSMVTNAEAVKSTLDSDSETLRFKMKRDPRITRVGAFIRKFSIDELPQLWNVLTGEMTLVGPRPPLPCEVAEYTDHQMRRLDVTPGITCTWQISGRSDIPFEQQVEMDLAYINNRSIWLDFLILIKTPLAVLSARGAY